MMIVNVGNFRCILKFCPLSTFKEMVFSHMSSIFLSKHILVFQLLLEAGLPAYPQNDDKNTPADLATSAGNKGIVSLLG